MPSAADTTVVIVTTYDAYNAISSSSDLTIQGAASTGAGVYSAVVGPYLNLNTATGAGNLAGINLVAAFVTVAKINADSAAGNDIALGDVIGLVGTGVTAVAAVAAIATGVVASPALITALGLIAAIGALRANQRGDTLNDLADAINDLFNAGRNFTQRRDPLTFDLDGDGLETVGISTANPILFDHDGDGVKTATGWVAPDDGFLVLDRNGNGTIDSGIELFGDSTPLATGGNAVDGFAALAQEDTNLDGKVDSADARFTDLRIWRDLNQDGISQSNELSTLAALNIASINVAKTENTTVLANGNVIADLGTYVKTDGSVATLGETAQLGDVDLADNPFYSDFADTITITPEAATLPDMQGSGQVRDLREAASLSATLVATLNDYANAPTRDTQVAQLDTLLKTWSDTSTMATTATGAYDGHALTVNFAGVTNGSAEHQSWLDKLTVLERFNGRTFQAVPVAANADWWECAA